MLARLANDTGGRLTRNTNDLSLGFARAQRDLGCQYTLGFYLESGARDRPRSMKVRVKRPGLRALHPHMYMLRSNEAERESTISAAFLSPEMFQTGNVIAHLFTLQPKSKERWETLIAISFPVTFDDRSPEAMLDFGGVLTRFDKLKNRFNRVAHRVDRRVTLRQRTGGTTERRFMFLEPVDLKPGRYELVVVMADTANGSRPEALRANLDLPAVTKRQLMLVKPIFGRPRDKNIVVRGDGPSRGRAGMSADELAASDIVATRGSFEPLLVQRFHSAEEVLSRNKACLVGSKHAPDGTVARQINEETDGDDESIELPEVPLELAAQGKVLCQNLFEVLPEEQIEDGRYLFEATIEKRSGARAAERVLPFAVADPK